jgi:transposase
MNAHLAEISRSVAPCAHAVLRRENNPRDHFLILLILEGTCWHGSAARIVPDNLSLLTLPPESPELNPVENVWH